MAAIAQIPLIPARRLHSEIDIIDVDALDDDIVYSQTRRSVRPRLSPAPGPSEAGPSRENPIIILDSDEEIDARGVVWRAPARRRHRLRSPPPPPVQSSAHRPSVPPIPVHLIGPHLHHPPAILPSANPLPFEANIARSRQRNDSPRLQSPRAAPRSHHQPSMGLGGALISLNRQQQIEERMRRANAEEAAARHRATRQQQHWVERWFPGITGSLFGEDDVFGGWPSENPFSRHMDVGYIVKPPEKSMAWKSSYTHPDKPAAGFTYNFDLSDQEEAKGSSASKAIVILDDDDTIGSTATESIPTLVCARCSDPLILAGSSDDESRKRRVWALRCGHMLDGKCIDELMRPAPPPKQPEPEGKGESVDEYSPPSLSSAAKGKGRAELTRTSRKGKGKAVARPLWDDVEGSMSSISGQPPLAGMGENSIRSRLRSRRPPERTVSTAATLVAAPEPMQGAASTVTTEPPSRTRPLTRKRSAAQASLLSMKPPARGKGKGRARKPQLLQSHEFSCSVEGCGRIHRSVLMSGEDWRMDLTEGALPLFV